MSNSYFKTVSRQQLPGVEAITWRKRPRRAPHGPVLREAMGDGVFVRALAVRPPMQKKLTWGR